MEGARRQLDILLVEDEPGDARLIEHHLEASARGPFAAPSLTHVTSLAAGLGELSEGNYDLLLLDLGLPETTGIETLDRYLQRAEENPDVPTLPVVVLTGLNDGETALKAVERGAQDYLVKDNVDGNSLDRTIRHALERHQQERELTIMKQVLTRVLRHNLRNDLSAVQGRAEVLAERGDRDLEDHANVILDLCDGLIDISEKARAVESVVEYDQGPRRQSLAGVLERTVETVQTSFPAATIDVEREGSPDVWAHPDLDAALENILESILAETDTDGLEATVQAEVESEEVRVTVDGTHLRVPQTEVEAIRAGEETGLKHASGVGLWLAYLVVDRSGGQLAFEVDANTAVAVTLPHATDQE
jgi:CheY-like chemotaxis protein